MQRCFQVGHAESESNRVQKHRDLLLSYSLALCAKIYQKHEWVNWDSGEDL